MNLCPACGNKNHHECPLCQSDHDPVNKPKHYNNHPSGVECIEVTRHMGFNLGNALKYIWRCDLKNNAVEDLEKAVWYLNDEIEKRKKSKAQIMDMIV